MIVGFRWENIFKYFSKTQILSFYLDFTNIKHRRITSIKMVRFLEKSVRLLS